MVAIGDNNTFGDWRKSMTNGDDRPIISAAFPCHVFESWPAWVELTDGTPPQRLLEALSLQT